MGLVWLLPGMRLMLDRVVGQLEDRIDKSEAQHLEQPVERSQFVRLCSASSDKVEVYVYNTDNSFLLV